MRETVRSLQAYFILTGLTSLCFGTLSVVADLRSAISPAAIVAAAIGIVGSTLALVFLYVGGALPSLLRSSSHRIVLLLYVSTGWAVVSFLLSLLNGVQGVTIFVLVISLLILWYLLRNVRRLAAEAKQPAPIA